MDDRPPRTLTLPTLQIIPKRRNEARLCSLVRWRLVRKRVVATCGMLACLLVSLACGGPQQAEGSPLCDALANRVRGINTIVWENGFTQEEATWGTLLDAGILKSDESTRRVAAAAVRADTEGFDEVMAAAPESLRPDLLRLRLVLLDPDSIESNRDDPDIVESIQAVLEASPPQVCNWVR